MSTDPTTTSEATSPLTDDELIAFRHALHAWPELSWQEQSTTAAVADQLTRAGLDPRVRADGTGLVCEFPVGSGEGPTVAIRADLDALPVPDTSDAPHASRVPGVSHACGHDLHTAAALGAGLTLALSPPDDLSGRVRLIFQPAEESLPSGAATMVAEGAADGLDAVLALHSDPHLEVGRVGVAAGPLTAAYHMVQIRLSGEGGHTARPHLTGDVVFAAGRVICDLPQLLARRLDSRAGLNLTFGRVAAGTASNVIPTEAIVEGALRCLTVDAWERVTTLVPVLVTSLTEPIGVAADVEVRRGSPPVVNDTALAATVGEALVELLGPEGVVTAEQSVGGEDFGWLCLEAPGCYLRLGVGRPGVEPMDLHTSGFDVADEAVPVGARVLTAAAAAALRSRR